MRIALFSTCIGDALFPDVQKATALVLSRLGHEVVFPEEQLANWTAVRYSADHIFDYIPVDQDYAIFEVEVPESWIGRSIGELNIRKNLKLNILARKQDGALSMEISPDTVFSEGETVLVLGRREGIREYFKL